MVAADFSSLSGTILAFDFGLKRIGVAVGNTVLRQSSPLAIIGPGSNAERFSRISSLIAEWQPVLCVVGLPLHPDGAEHEMTLRCRRFAHQLEGRCGMRTAFVDERYSSAILAAKQGERIDDQAAAVILQQYFDQTS